MKSLCCEYWLKVVAKRETNFVSLIHKMMLKDIDNDNRKVNWASLVKTLCNLGFYDVWVIKELVRVGRKILRN